MGVLYVTEHHDSISNETMYLIEAFFFAACELKEIDWAKAFLTIIRNEHPRSVKSMRLLGVWYEAQNDAVKAQEIYLDMIEGNNADVATIKRLVCLFRDMDMMKQAISILNKYLENNMEDHEAWKELADIYLSKQ